MCHAWWQIFISLIAQPCPENLIIIYHRLTGITPDSDCTIDLDDDDASTHLSIERHDDFVCICFVLLFCFVFLPGNESETSVIIVWATAAYEWTYSPCVCDSKQIRWRHCDVQNDHGHSCASCLPGLLFCAAALRPVLLTDSAGRPTSGEERWEHMGARRESRGRFLTLLILLEEAG